MVWPWSGNRTSAPHPGHFVILPAYFSAVVSRLPQVQVTVIDIGVPMDRVSSVLVTIAAAADATLAGTALLRRGAADRTGAAGEGSARRTRRRRRRHRRELVRG